DKPDQKRKKRKELSGLRRTRHPVMVEFRQMGEGGEIFHPVEEDLPIQVVDFMLQYHRQEPFRFKLHRLHVTVKPFHAGPDRPKDLPTEVIDAQAPLPPLLLFFREIGEGGIQEDQKGQVGSGGVSGVCIRLDDNHLLRLADLRRGQSDTVELPHRFGHIFQKSLESGIVRLGHGDRLRDPPKNWISKFGDLQNSHAIPFVFIYISQAGGVCNCRKTISDRSEMSMVRRKKAPIGAAFPMGAAMRAGDHTPFLIFLSASFPLSAFTARSPNETIPTSLFP